MAFIDKKIKEKKERTQFNYGIYINGGGKETPKSWLKGGPSINNFFICNFEQYLILDFQRHRAPKISHRYYSTFLGDPIVIYTSRYLKYRKRIEQIQ